MPVCFLKIRVHLQYMSFRLFLELKLTKFGYKYASLNRTVTVE